MARDKIYQKVTDYLKNAIASGEMKLGEAIYSENQLCEILNVSRNSVRRAIREMIEYNILESRQGVGTFVKGLNPSKTVCLVNHYTRILRYSPVDAYYTNLIFAAEEYAGKENYRFQIFSGAVREENDIIGKMSHLNADGVILDARFQDYWDDIGIIHRHYPNLVLLDGNPNETKLPVVAPDLVPGMIELLQLIPTSRRGNILFLYNGTVVQRRWVRDCFKAALKQSSHSVESIEFSDYAENIPFDILQCINPACFVADNLEPRLAAKTYKAIVCDSDRTAMYTIDYLTRHNLSVPGDIAVSGVGNSVYSSMTAPGTTTLKIDTAVLAATAVELLAKQIRGEQVPGKKLLPVDLLRRSSL